MADVDEEDVDGRLRGSDHIFGWRNELDDTMVQLRTRPSVTWLVPDLVPVEELRDFVGE